MTETIINLENSSVTEEEIKKLQEKNIKRILLQYIKKEIAEIPNIFNGLDLLVNIDFSASQIKSLQNDLFKQTRSLYSINFSFDSNFDANVSIVL